MAKKLATGDWNLEEMHKYQLAMSNFVITTWLLITDILMFENTMVSKDYNWSANSIYNHSEKAYITDTEGKMGGSSKYKEQLNRFFTTFQTYASTNGYLGKLILA